MGRFFGRFAVARASALVLLIAAGGTAPALAQHERAHGAHGAHGHGHGGPGPGHARTPGRQWHGNIARFHEHDWPVWRGGHWSHARHGGRIGWWWVVGPTWYFYPQPVYPYPSPWVPADIISVAPTEAAPMPPAQYWYYCEASRSYYPYVSYCPGGWKQVPAAPDAGVPAPLPRVP